MIRSHKRGSDFKRSARGNQVYTKVKRRKTKKKKSLVKRVKELSSRVKELDVFSTREFTSYETHVLSALANEQSSWYFRVGNKSALASFAAQVQILDEDTMGPKNLVLNSAFSSGLMQMNVESVYMKLQIRNNYDEPADVKVYELSVKLATNDDPLQLFDQSVDHIGLPSPYSGAGNARDGLNYYPTVSGIFNDNFKVDKVTSYRMNGGDEVTCSVSEGPFKWDYQTDGLAGSLQLRPEMTKIILVVTKGVIAHDTVGAPPVPTAPHFAPCSLDMIATKKTVIKYQTPEQANIKNVDWTGLPAAASSVIVGPNVVQL